MARPMFDAGRDFVAARAFPYNGHPYKAGEPFNKEGLAAHQLKTLYGSRFINFGEKDAAAADPVTITEGKGGWFEVTAAWLDDPIKIQGRKKAEKIAAEVREAGEPLEHSGVALLEGENGWWDVRTDWAEVEKVHGAEAAYARAAELRGEGAPADAVLVRPAGEGRFIVIAPWLADPIELPERQKADYTAGQVREAGPPIGWVSPAAAE